MSLSFERAVRAFSPADAAHVRATLDSPPTAAANSRPPTGRGGGDRLGLDTYA